MLRPQAASLTQPFVSQTLAEIPVSLANGGAGNHAEQVDGGSSQQRSPQVDAHVDEGTAATPALPAVAVSPGQWGAETAARASMEWDADLSASVTSRRSASGSSRGVSSSRRDSVASSTGSGNTSDLAGVALLLQAAAPSGAKSAESPAVDSDESGVTGTLNMSSITDSSGAGVGDSLDTSGAASGGENTADFTDVMKLLGGRTSVGSEVGSAAKSTSSSPHDGASGAASPETEEVVPAAAPEEAAEAAAADSPAPSLPPASLRRSPRIRRRLSVTSQPTPAGLSTMSVAESSVGGTPQPGEERDVGGATYAFFATPDSVRTAAPASTTGTGHAQVDDVDEGKETVTSIGGEDVVDSPQQAGSPGAESGRTSPSADSTLASVHSASMASPSGVIESEQAADASMNPAELSGVLGSTSSESDEAHCSPVSHDAKAGLQSASPSASPGSKRRRRRSSASKNSTGVFSGLDASTAASPVPVTAEERDQVVSGGASFTVYDDGIAGDGEDEGNDGNEDQAEDQGEGEELGAENSGGAKGVPLQEIMLDEADGQSADEGGVGSPGHVFSSPAHRSKTPAKSILTGRKKVGSAKGVVFGAPQAAEFHRSSPPRSMTPLPSHEARAFFSMNTSGSSYHTDSSGAPSSADDFSDEEEMSQSGAVAEEDEETALNSSILQQWEGGDDASSSDEADAGEDSGSSGDDEKSADLASTGSRSSRTGRSSSRRSSMGPGNSPHPNALVDDKSRASARSASSAGLNSSEDTVESADLSNASSEEGFVRGGASDVSATLDFSDAAIRSPDASAGGNVENDDVTGVSAVSSASESPAWQSDASPSSQHETSVSVSVSVSGSEDSVVGSAAEGANSSTEDMPTAFMDDSMFSTSTSGSHNTSAVGKSVVDASMADEDEDDEDDDADEESARVTEDDSESATEATGEASTAEQTEEEVGTPRRSKRLREASPRRDTTPDRSRTGAAAAPPMSPAASARSKRSRLSSPAASSPGPSPRRSPRLAARAASEARDSPAKSVGEEEEPVELDVMREAPLPSPVRRPRRRASIATFGTSAGAAAAAGGIGMARNRRRRASVSVFGLTAAPPAPPAAAASVPQASEAAAQGAGAGTPTAPPPAPGTPAVATENRAPASARSETTDDAESTSGERTATFKDVEAFLHDAVDTPGGRSAGGSTVGDRTADLNAIHGLLGGGDTMTMTMNRVSLGPDRTASTGVIKGLLSDEATATVSDVSRVSEEADESAAAEQSEAEAEPGESDGAARRARLSLDSTAMSIIDGGRPSLDVDVDRTTELGTLGDLLEQSEHRTVVPSASKSTDGDRNAESNEDRTVELGNLQDLLADGDATASAGAGKGGAVATPATAKTPAEVGTQRTATSRASAPDTPYQAALVDLAVQGFGETPGSMALSTSVSRNDITADEQESEMAADTTADHTAALGNLGDLLAEPSPARPAGRVEDDDKTKELGSLGDLINEEAGVAAAPTDADMSGADMTFTGDFAGAVRAAAMASGAVSSDSGADSSGDESADDTASVQLAGFEAEERALELLGVTPSKRLPSPSAQARSSRRRRRDASRSPAPSRAKRGRWSVGSDLSETGSRLAAALSDAGASPAPSLAASIRSARSRRSRRSVGSARSVASPALSRLSAKVARLEAGSAGAASAKSRPSDASTASTSDPVDSPLASPVSFHSRMSVGGRSYVSVRSAASAASGAGAGSAASEAKIEPLELHTFDEFAQAVHLEYAPVSEAVVSARAVAAEAADVVQAASTEARTGLGVGERLFGAIAVAPQLSTLTFACEELRSIITASIEAVEDMDKTMSTTQPSLFAVAGAAAATVAAGRGDAAEQAAREFLDKCSALQDLHARDARAAWLEWRGRISETALGVLRQHAEMLRQETAAISELAAELSAATDRVQAARKAVATATEERTDMAKLADEANELEEKLEAWRVEVLDVRGSVTALREAVEAATSRRESAAATLTELGEPLDAAEAARAAAAEAVAAVVSEDASSDADEAEIARARAEVDRMAEDYDILSGVTEWELERVTSQSFNVSFRHASGSAHFVEITVGGPDGADEEKSASEGPAPTDLGPGVARAKCTFRAAKRPSKARMYGVDPAFNDAMVLATGVDEVFAEVATTADVGPALREAALRFGRARDFCSELERLKRSFDVVQHATVPETGKLAGPGAIMAEVRVLFSSMRRRSRFAVTFGVRRGYPFAKFRVAVEWHIGEPAIDAVRDAAESATYEYDALTKACQTIQKLKF